MLRKMIHAALLAGALFAPAEALGGGWRGDHHGWGGGDGRPHGGWGGHGAYRSGCWRWWYGRWVWAC